ncbi:MAG: hypothetical protein WAN50_01280 [Minisyncoccia bacterium]
MTETTEPFSIEERQAHDKQKVLDALKEMPIVQIACKKAGISRPTYYRWRQEDKIFRRQAVDAMNHGVEFINDMSESQIISLIKDKKLQAMALWLKHNHPKYGAKVKEYTPLSADDDLTEDEQKIVMEALSLIAQGTHNVKPYERNRTPIDADKYGKK